MICIIAVFIFISTAFFFVIYTQTRKIFSLKGKHVLITGGSSGIGIELAREALKIGANVTIVARDLERLDMAKNNLKPFVLSNAWISTLSVDLSNYKLTEQKLLSCETIVDVLINCAGFAVARTCLETPIETYVSLMETNYLASVNVIKTLLPSMISTSVDGLVTPRDRRIACVSSMAGEVGIYGLSGYSASKFALRGFVDALRMELETVHLPVTLAFPPDTDTPGLKSENVGKPALTKILCATGGFASASDVASKIMYDVLKGRRVSYFGFEGMILALLTANISPPVLSDLFFRNVFSSLVEILLAPFLRLIGICYSWWMRRVVLKNPFHQPSIE